MLLAFGEVALVSKQFIINQTGKLYYNGLIDENAASHLAFGASFPSNIKGDTFMSEEELLQHGVNHASCHQDFMVGTLEYHVVGITQDNQEITIMERADLDCWIVACREYNEDPVFAFLTPTSMIAARRRRRHSSMYLYPSIRCIWTCGRAIHWLM